MTAYEPFNVTNYCFNEINYLNKIYLILLNFILNK